MCRYCPLERRQGREPSPETLRFRPQDWEALARRFLKSLDSDTTRRWIEKLALTPRFDEAAARAAYSSDLSAAQDAEWNALRDYSFVDQIEKPAGWLTIRSQMRWALENQPSAKLRVKEDHEWWRAYWTSRAKSEVDLAAEAAWYHRHRLAPALAGHDWNRLAEAARTAVPPRMEEHFDLLHWWEAVGVLDRPPSSPEEAYDLNRLGVELYEASLGNHDSNLRQAKACYTAALRVYTEAAFPPAWALVQNNLGNVWSELPTVDQASNLREAISCYDAALRIFTEDTFPQNWAMTQANLAKVWFELPIGDRAENLQLAIAFCESAMRVFTEERFPREWAQAQSALGTLWTNLPTGDRTTNLQKAISCCKSSLRVFTEQRLPQDWASTQNVLGGALVNLDVNDRSRNIQEAIACHEASLRVFTEHEFPEQWARTQGNLALACLHMPGKRSTPTCGVL